MDVGSAKVHGIEAVAAGAARALEQIAAAVREVHIWPRRRSSRKRRPTGTSWRSRVQPTQEVSQAASEHASASEQVTAAAQEQTASTQEMAAAAGDLLQGATRLTALMQDFKT